MNINDLGRGGYSRLNQAGQNVSIGIPIMYEIFSFSLLISLSQNGPLIVLNAFKINGLHFLIRIALGFIKPIIQ